MKEYVTPALELVSFVPADIVTTSGHETTYTFNLWEKVDGDN